MTRLSVIVPALDEEADIQATLQRARVAAGPDSELVVVDGGSRDRTRALAAPLARVLRAGPGRGSQLNAGARAASGEILLFLHADTLLDPDVGARIREALAEPGVVGGCCRFAVHPPAGGRDRWTLLERAVNLRTRALGSATGDQALFATRRAYEGTGGFPEWPLFEDVAFVRRLKRLGTFHPVAAAARTSRRRWEREGFWRTVLRHWALRALFQIGVSPRRLAAWYGHAAPPASPRPERSVSG